MNDEKLPPKPGLLYWLGIAIMIMLLVILCMVPVILIGMAFRPDHAAFHSQTSPHQETAPSPDLSGLRAVAEKAASNILPEPAHDSLNSSLLELRIRILSSSPDLIQKAKKEVFHILAINQQHYLETDDKDATQLIVTLKGNEWSVLVDQLRSRAENGGYIVASSSEEPISEGRQDVVGKIEIFTK